MPLSRRELLHKGSVLTSAFGLWGGGWSTTSASELAQIDPDIRLLERFSFGASIDDVRQIKEMGVTDFLSDQLLNGGLDPAIEGNVQQWFPSIALSASELKALAESEELKPAQVANELKMTTLYRAAKSRYQLYEVMVDFWSNHFNIYHGDGVLRVLKTIDDREVIRPYALSSFRELLHASAKSPAMLVYLDNVSSTKDGFNENYARELLELHTLGVEGGYQQTDIEAVARILTGWGISREEGELGTFRFYAQRHDYDEKVVMEQVYPPGQGFTEGERLLNQLVDHSSTRLFIAAKLCRRFISDEPSPSVIETVADAWGEDGDIKQMLVALVSTDEFYSSSQLKLKRPLDFALSMMRAGSAKLENQDLRRINGALRSLGQIPFDYPAPTGFSDLASDWISTSGLLNRWNLASQALGYKTDGAFPIRNSWIQPELLIDSPLSVEGLVDQLVEKLLHGKIDDEGYEQLVSFAQLRLGELDGPGLNTIVRDLTVLVFSSPYFQWH